MIWALDLQTSSVYSICAWSSNYARDRDTLGSLCNRGRSLTTTVALISSFIISSTVYLHFITIKCPALDVWRRQKARSHYTTWALHHLGMIRAQCTYSLVSYENFASGAAHIEEVVHHSGSFPRCSLPNNSASLDNLLCATLTAIATLQAHRIIVRLNQEFLSFTRGNLGCYVDASLRPNYETLLNRGLYGWQPIAVKKR